MKDDALTIYVSPNRANLTFTVTKVQKKRQLAQLTWLVKLLKEKGKETPKTIIFCNTMVEIAAVVNFLINQLRNHAYDKPDVKSSETCLIGVYHSQSWESTNNMVIASFKGNGIVCAVLAMRQARSGSLTHSQRCSASAINHAHKSVNYRKSCSPNCSSG